MRSSTVEKDTDMFLISVGKANAYAHRHTCARTASHGTLESKHCEHSEQQQSRTWFTHRLSTETYCREVASVIYCLNPHIILNQTFNNRAANEPARSFSHKSFIW